MCHGVYSKTYQNFFILDVFRATTNEKYLVNLQFRRADYLIKKSTFFNNPVSRHALTLF